MAGRYLLEEAHTLPSAKRGRLLHLAGAWLPVLICVLIITLESTAVFGADQTSGPLQRFYEFLFGPVTRSQWWGIHHTIRKCGHFIGYGILSVAWFRAFWLTTQVGKPVWRRIWAAHLLAMAGTFLVASADEFHQTFLPNRTGTPWDVLLDCSGAAFLQALVWVWMRRRARQ